MPLQRWPRTWTSPNFGLASVASQLWTPFTLLLAWPLLGERPSMHVMTGVVITFCGVVLTAVDPDVSVPAVPTPFVVRSGRALAIGTVLTKPYGLFDPTKLMACVALRMARTATPRLPARL
jgi:O-acetylserine/cysteine efflux transporter